MPARGGHRPFYLCLTWQLSYAEDYIQEYKDGWWFYPSAEDADFISSIETEIAGMPPERYDLVVCQWPLYKTLIYMEQRRVNQEMDDFG